MEIAKAKLSFFSEQKPEKKTATIATYKLPVNKGTMLLLLRILMRVKERKKPV